MFNIGTLKTELINLVSWQQNVDATGWQITDTDLLTPTSGMYFNGVHPMLSFDNVRSIAPDFDVLHPADSAARNTAFSAWLRDKTEQGIAMAMHNWFNSKMTMLTANNLLEQTELFKGAPGAVELEPNAGRVVGLQITPTRQKSIKTTIRRISVQFTENQTITIKLFKSGTMAPVKTVDVVYAGSGGVQWETVDWELEPEGTYLIAYDQDDTIGNAINGIYDYTFASQRHTWPNGRYFGTVGFNVAAAGVAVLWGLDDTEHTVDTNYGLNLDVDVQCDYTDFIVSQKHLFANVIRLHVGWLMLKEIAYNPEMNVNRNAANEMRTNLLFDINGDTQGKDGFSVYGQLKQAIEAVQFDTTGIEKICLPCRRRSARIRSIGPDALPYGRYK
jgi:hypothetical protein